MKWKFAMIPWSLALITLIFQPAGAFKPIAKRSNILRKSSRDALTLLPSKKSSSPGSLHMSDTSSAYWFKVGNTVPVVDDVEKYGGNLKGRLGQVIARCAQTFSPKIVLEVFGGGGAIWGASEIMTFRNPQTNDFWRPCATIFGAIFFLRFCLQIKDFVSQNSKNKHCFESVDMIRFFKIFSAKFVLEVCGGGGAIWGSMEALGIRNFQTQEFWRLWSSVFLCIFLVRYVKQAKDYITQTGEPNVHPWIRLIQTFSAKFVLEVLGGAGAVWGWSEIITLRNTETIWLWRPISLTVGVIFLCRWFLQIYDYVAEIS